jgi:D-glycero-D-manno-heptose 1,7-bisphosphate phosphatase
LIEQAVARFGFSPAECVVVGDKPCDIDLGRRVGSRTILVRTGYGAEFEALGPIGADAVADDLLDACVAIQRWRRGA